MIQSLYFELKNCYTKRRKTYFPTTFFFKCVSRFSSGYDLCQNYCYIKRHNKKNANDFFYILKFLLIGQESVIQVWYHKRETMSSDFECKNLLYQTTYKLIPNNFFSYSENFVGWLGINHAGIIACKCETKVWFVVTKIVVDIKVILQYLFKIKCTSIFSSHIFIHHITHHKTPIILHITKH